MFDSFLSTFGSFGCWVPLSLRKGWVLYWELAPDVVGGGGEEPLLRRRTLGLLALGTAEVQRGLNGAGLKEEEEGWIFRTEERVELRNSWSCGFGLTRDLNRV